MLCDSSKSLNEDAHWKSFHHLQPSASLSRTGSRDVICVKCNCMDINSLLKF
jgi:hypothetical protein